MWHAAQRDMKIWLASVLGFLIAFPIRPAEVTVFAASSLTDVLKTIAARYETDSTNRIRFNFAASGTLARQIDAGAPADIFVSADATQMDRLRQRGLLVLETLTNRLGNSLVLITATGELRVKSPTDLTNQWVRRIALGDPQLVPAGAYAKAFLERQGIWPAVQAKVVPCVHVRNVLAVVKAGNADAGFVYQTDLTTSLGIRSTYNIPTKDAPEIVYSLAVLKEAREPMAARQFFEYLNSQAATEAFRAAGFSILIPTDHHER